MNNNKLNIDQLQNVYNKAFNAYLSGIQSLLTTYSIRDLCRTYPHIEQQHIRLASELLIGNNRLDDAINPYCLYELREMSKIDRRRWLHYIKTTNATPTLLRKALREDKKRSRSKKKNITKTKPNQTMRAIWLIQRRLRNCSNDAEKQEMMMMLINAELPTNRQKDRSHSDNKPKGGSDYRRDR